jgi:hypothetical protein
MEGALVREFDKHLLQLRYIAIARRSRIVWSNIGGRHSGQVVLFTLAGTTFSLHFLA